MTKATTAYNDGRQPKQVLTLGRGGGGLLHGTEGTCAGGGGIRELCSI